MKRYLSSCLHECSHEYMQYVSTPGRNIFRKMGLFCDPKRILCSCNLTKVSLLRAKKK